MFFYKDETTSEVFCYETESERAEFGSESLVPMTAEEVVAHIEKNSPKPASVLDAVKMELRPARDRLLRIVEGIALAAMVEGDSSVISEIYGENGIRRKLLDVTDIEALNSDSTEDEARSAVKAYYAAIVASASNKVKVAFKEIEQ